MDAVSAQLLAQVDAQKSLFEMITGPGFSTQASFALLRSSLTAKCGFLLRAARPTVMAPAAAAFDRLQLEFVRRRMDIDHAEFSETAKEIVFLPVKAGGLGLRSAAATSQTAWLSVRAACVGFFSIISSDPKGGRCSHCQPD
jgi:hypothetical protein